MNHRTAVFGLMLSGWLAVATTFTQPEKNSRISEVDAKRPNIVLVMADDQGYGDFSF